MSKGDISITELHSVSKTVGFDSLDDSWDGMSDSTCVAEVVCCTHCLVLWSVILCHRSWPWLAWLRCDIVILVYTLSKRLVVDEVEGGVRVLLDLPARSRA